MTLRLKNVILKQLNFIFGFEIVPFITEFSGTLDVKSVFCAVNTTAASFTILQDKLVVLYLRPVRFACVLPEKLKPESDEMPGFPKKFLLLVMLSETVSEVSAGSLVQNGLLPFVDKSAFSLFI